MDVKALSSSERFSKNTQEMAPGVHVPILAALSSSDWDQLPGDCAV